MTRRISPADLDSWRDPVALLDALTSVRNEDLADLRDSVARLVDHDDADVRAHAIRRLFVHLKDDGRHQDAIQLLHGDPEAKVRRAAAFAVASTTSPKTRDADVRALLATFLNENEKQAVRGAAYEALLLVHHRRDFPPVKREIDFARDVDWAWIRQLEAGLSG